ncbi:MAG TPA: hypothetical protein VMK66_06220 [Myxococcales bacterium]|nr:hypothetical protein [Myxococcales bacterium]
METQAPGPRWRRRLAAVVFVIGALAVLYTWATLHVSYDKGERVGYVLKFARRGWVCKTWEGELAMANVPGVTPEKFHFSTRDAAIAARVNTMLGSRVRIRYVQHKFVPSTCFGETEFFITEALPIEPVK